MLCYFFIDITPSLTLTQSDSSYKYPTKESNENYLY